MRKACHPEAGRFAGCLASHPRAYHSEPSRVHAYEGKCGGRRGCRRGICFSDRAKHQIPHRHRAGTERKTLIDPCHSEERSGSGVPVARRLCEQWGGGEESLFRFGFTGKQVLHLGREILRFAQNDNRAFKDERRRPALLLLAAVVFFAGNALAANKPIEWKPASQPLLRMDNRPVAEWNVYQPGKKLNPLLVEMNGRYLEIDQEKETVFEVPAAKITKKGDDLYWNPEDRPDKPLETSGWIVKDVGSAYRVSMKLVAENHVLDVQIPHPMDLRPITPRYF